MIKGPRSLHAFYDRSHLVSFMRMNLMSIRGKKQFLFLSDHSSLSKSQNRHRSRFRSGDLMAHPEASKQFDEITWECLKTCHRVFDELERMIQINPLAPAFLSSVSLG